jgi:hypothetical protein
MITNHLYLSLKNSSYPEVKEVGDSNVIRIFFEFLFD